MPRVVAPKTGMNHSEKVEVVNSSDGGRSEGEERGNGRLREGVYMYVVCMAAQPPLPFSWEMGFINFSCLSHHMDKCKGSHLTDSSPHLPVTLAQMMRPGIGQNTSCAVGDLV